MHAKILSFYKLNLQETEKYVLQQTRTIILLTFKELNDLIT